MALEMSSQVSSAQAEKEVERLDKAMKVVESEGVRLHKFLPSGLQIWTVVGRECEYLVHPKSNLEKPYCACDDFHYRVLSAKTEEGYHLVAVKRAIAEERYTVVEMQDRDFQGFVKRLLSGIFQNIS